MRAIGGQLGLAALTAGALLLCAPVLAADEVRTAPTRHGGGIWKAAVPPGSMKGEFGGHDPIGLASGAKIKADCSINWVDPNDGKLYCFSSATSQSYFQDWPASNIKRASDAWQAMVKPGS